MTTKAKVVGGLILSTVLATGLYASCGKQDRASCDRGDKSSCQMKGKYHKKMMHHGKKMPMVKMFKKLDLTDKQRQEVKAIMMDFKKSHGKMSDAFTKSSFDKEKFIKMMEEKKANKIQNKANLVEKLYNILDSKQKEKLKTLMDEKKEMMQKRYHSKG